MVGKYSIEVTSNYTRYFLTVERNITVIQGRSATGKSELIRLLTSYETDGISSGVIVRSDVPIHVVDSRQWEILIQSYSKCIIFIDETADFVKSEDFARLVQKNNNYFVIVNRDPLKQLSYSIEEIYGFRVSHESQKYHGAYRVYNELYHLYHLTPGSSIAPTKVITEDTNSGFTFFQKLFNEKCIAAGGKSRVVDKLDELDSGEDVLLIVDGAAFGSEIARVIRYLYNHQMNCAVYAPESFEYLLLRAGFVSVSKKMLEETYNYADSARYISWEDFYTSVLIRESQGTVYRYSKQRLNSAYLSDASVTKVKREIPPQIKV